MGFSNLLKQPRDVEPVASVSNRDYVSPELTQVLAKSGYVNVHRSANGSCFRQACSLVQRISAHYATLRPYEARQDPDASWRHGDGLAVYPHLAPILGRYPNGTTSERIGWLLDSTLEVHAATSAPHSVLSDLACGCSPHGRYRSLYIKQHRLRTQKHTGQQPDCGYQSQKKPPAAPPQKRDDPPPVGNPSRIAGIAAIGCNPISGGVRQ
jgi:hypothetical protein